MIRKPEGYDQAQAYTGESMQLPAGCYVCIVKQAQQTESRNGRPQLAVLYDIAEGDQKGFYQAQFNNAKKMSSDAKWKGVYKQVMDGNSVPFLKGLITSIEKSNNYQFPWNLEGNEKSLVGKKFGAVMGRREFLTQDNEKRFVTEIFQVRSLEGLKDAKTPEDKLLSDDDQERYEESQRPAAQPSNDPALAKDGFMNIPDGIDEELPFM